MSTLTNDLLKDRIVALRIAVPGEETTQHNGRIVAVDDSTIAIVNTTENSTDLIITVYSWKYVVLVQYIQSVEIPAVEESESIAKKAK